MQTQPSSNPTRKLLPAALAALVFGTAGVLVIWMMIPPAATRPSAALDREAAASQDGKSGSATLPGERAPFTSPATPAATTRQETREDEGERKQTNLQQPALAGRVVDSRSRPISGALIKLARADADGPRNAITRADRSGEFAIQNLSPGTWRLATIARGYRPRSVSVTVPRADRLDLVLEDDRGLKVAVTDSNGTPVVGARVALRIRSLSLPGPRSGSTTAAGTVTLSGILTTGPEWSGQLRVKHGDYLPLEQSITTEDLDRGELQVVLETGGELRLRIVSPDGKPVSGALVTAFPKDTLSFQGAGARRLRSVSSGEVHFRNLRPGDYTISATTNRDGQAVARGLAVVAGPAPEVREIPLVRGRGSLTIRVITHDGEALPLCSVRLTAPDAIDGRKPYRDSVTDESGTCRFEALAGTRYDVEVGGGKFTQARRSGVSPDGREIVLNCDRPGSIAGRVELPQVTGGYGIRVSGERGVGGTGGTGAAYRRVVRFSAARRGFTLRYMPRGTYTLELLVDGKTLATVEGVEVRPGEKTEGVTFGESESES